MPSQNGDFIHIWHVEEFALDISPKKGQKLCVMVKMKSDVKYVIFLYGGMVCFVPVVDID